MARESHTVGDGPDPSLDPSNLGAFLELHRPRLRRMVAVRLDPILRRRIDCSDVLQESFAEVTRRLGEYQGESKMPFFLWVRLITAQKLAELHRRHLGAAMRDVRREAAGVIGFETSSVSLARAIVARTDSPSQVLARKEREELVREVLDGMKPIDREILMLRHFEQLSNEECARVLGLSSQGANSRHLRAVKRLSERLGRHPDLLSGPLRTWQGRGAVDDER